VPELDLRTVNTVSACLEAICVPWYSPWSLCHLPCVSQVTTMAVSYRMFRRPMLRLTVPAKGRDTSSSPWPLTEPLRL
jgi:hypothetical protein